MYHDSCKHAGEARARMDLGDSHSEETREETHERKYAVEHIYAVGTVGARRPKRPRCRAVGSDGRDVQF